MRLVDGDTGVLGDEGLVDVDEQLAADVIRCIQKLVGRPGLGGRADETGNSREAEQ